LPVKRKKKERKKTHPYYYFIRVSGQSRITPETQTQIDQLPDLQLAAAG
jgi:hypothetical protein